MDLLAQCSHVLYNKEILDNAKQIKNLQKANTLLKQSIKQQEVQIQHIRKKFSYERFCFVKQQLLPLDIFPAMLSYVASYYGLSPQELYTNVESVSNIDIISDKYRDVAYVNKDVYFAIATDEVEVDMYDYDPVLYDIIPGKKFIQATTLDEQRPFYFFFFIILLFEEGTVQDLEEFDTLMSQDSYIIRFELFIHGQFIFH